MRKYYWYLSAYLRKHGKTLVVSLVLAIAFFSLVLPTALRVVSAKPKRYIGLIGQYSLASLPNIISDDISLGLTKLETDGTVSSAASERWSVEDEGRMYRFVIRQDLRWHDGKLLSPEDIKYQFSDVERISTPNDVVFKLPAAFVPFPSSVAQPLLRYVEEPAYVFFKRIVIVGLGPSKVISYKLQGNFIKELTTESASERKVYRFYLTEPDAVTAFKKGQVDILADLTQGYDVADWPTTTVSKSLQTSRYLAAFFNMNNPLFKKNVRQSLSYALPKPTNDTRAIGPIDPQSWVYLSAGKSYDYDLERAKERMMDSLPDQPLTFSLTTTSLFTQRAEEIKLAWESFGQHMVTYCQSKASAEEKDKCPNTQIEVTVKITGFPDTNDYEVLLIGQEIPRDPDQYFMWHSNQSTNFTGYKNTRIDSLLEKGRTIAEKEERKALYQEFQQFLLEDAPAAFIEHLHTFEVRRK